MTNPARIDPDDARARFETALETQVPGFETFFLARLMGLRFTYLPVEAADADKDCCRVEFEVTPMLFNPQGTLHGGIMASVMDVSMGHLLARTVGAGATIEMKVQFMRPVGPGHARCEGRFVRRGRALSFMESRFFAPDGKLSALATATWKMPEPKLAP